MHTIQLVSLLAAFGAATFAAPETVRVEGGEVSGVYYFTHVPPHPRARELQAFHAAEIPYVFNVVPSTDPREAGFAYTAADRQLADRMSR